MANSLDDLLRKNDAAAKAKAEMEQQKEVEKARRSELTTLGAAAFQQILDRIRPIIEEFNSRSTSGNIRSTMSGNLRCLFNMPLGGTMTLTGVVDLKERAIKGKRCTFMATLEASNDRGVHFLLLEDQNPVNQPEWVVVRARIHPLVRNAHERLAPFITTLDEIERGTTATAVIDPVYGGEINDAVIEVIGYAI